MVREAHLRQSDLTDSKYPHKRAGEEDEVPPNQSPRGYRTWEERVDP